MMNSANTDVQDEIIVLRRLLREAIERASDYSPDTEWLIEVWIDSLDNWSREILERAW